MSGRDFGRGGRGGYGDRDRDRDRDRGRGGFRDRDRDRGSGPGGPRPWERRDDDERPARPSGDRPFDRPRRDDDEIRVERYYEEPPRPRRDDRGDRGDRGDRPRRYGDDRERGRDRGFEGPPRAGRGDVGGRDTRPAAGGAGALAGPREPFPEPRADAAQRAYEGAAAPPATPFAGGPAADRQWTYHHLADSWRDEERLRGWTPSDQDLQEMVEDNIEADPQLNARDRRNIKVQAQHGVVTLTGTVRSRLAKFAAGSDAYWTYGVQEVRNELAVRVRGPQAQGEDQPAAQPAAPIVTAAPAEPAETTAQTPATAPAPAASEAATTTATSDAPDASAGTDTAGAEAPATVPKRASRRKAAAAPTEPSADVEGPEAHNPPAMGGDSADSGEPGFMPPRESPAPNAPEEGLVVPPLARGSG